MNNKYIKLTAVLICWNSVF